MAMLVITRGVFHEMLDACRVFWDCTNGSLFWMAMIMQELGPGHSSGDPVLLNFIILFSEIR